MAISWRESAKALACHYRGDPSIKSIGKTSFAMSNLDPIGSLLAPVLLILRQNYVYGWTESTVIRKNFLKGGQTDVIGVVCIGFLANLAMAIGWLWMAKLALGLERSLPTVSEFLLIAAEAGVQINILLICIHLIPLPPLDMSYVVRGLLPRYPKALYTQFDPIGHYIITLLLLFKVAQPYIKPLYELLSGELQMMVGL
jgi:Zn-dependent protease